MSDGICGFPVPTSGFLRGKRVPVEVELPCTKRPGHVKAAGMVGADKVHSHRAEVREGDPRIAKLNEW